MVGKKKIKRQFKSCNNIFRMCKLEDIRRVECREDRVLVQVSAKEEVENAIIK